MNLLELAIKSMFGENVVLALFLGLCPFIVQSKKVSNIFFLGLTVTLVMAIVTPINYLIFHYFLKQNAFYENSDLRFLRFLVFIATIATVVQIIEKVILRYFPKMQSNLGIFLPLITVNCAIFGVSLFATSRDYGFLEATIFGAFSGLGWLFAGVILATIRIKVASSDIPKGLQGSGIAFIITGIMALAFMALMGIKFN